MRRKIFVKNRQKKVIKSGRFISVYYIDEAMSKFLSKVWNCVSTMQIEGSCIKKLKIRAIKEWEMEVESGNCAHGQVGNGKNEK